MEHLAYQCISRLTEVLKSRKEVAGSWRVKVTMETHFVVKWDTPLQVFKYADGHPEHSNQLCTNHRLEVLIVWHSGQKHTQIDQEGLEGL